MDFEILDFIQQYLRSDFLDTVVPLITHLGDAGILWIILAIVLLIRPETRKAGIIVACALIADGVVCNLVLKPLVARIRPFDVNTGVQLLIAAPTDYSFPSGHTAASFASVAALYLAGCRKLWKGTLVIAILIAFSRLYLYVHYPTDVLGGVIVGLLCGGAGYGIAEWVTKLVMRFHHNKK